MNRRSFIRLLPMGGVGMLLAGEVLCARGSEPATRIDLSRYATPYTPEVGGGVLRSGRFEAVLEALDRRLFADNEAQAQRLHDGLRESIEQACRQGRFWEVDGWVVTPAEAMLSALIVQGGD